MDAEFWGEVFATPGLGVWMRIMAWVFALGALFVFTRLLRGGFNDLTEIARSRYATAGERWRARSQYPGRLALIAMAAMVGSAGFALTVFIQGAVVLFIWTQATG
jgi:hypothetical protein